MTNPPFGTKKGGERATRDDFTFTTSNKQLNFLQHIYRSLKRGGRAAVVLPDNVLFESNVGDQVRCDLMDKCNLHTILRLPTGIFYANGVKTNVLFFERGMTDKRNTTEVWVYDLRTNMRSFGKKNPLKHEDFAGFEAAYTAEDRRTVEDERWRAFTRDEIRKTDADGNETNSLDIGLIRDDSIVDYDELPIICRERRGGDRPAAARYESARRRRRRAQVVRGGVMARKKQAKTPEQRLGEALVPCEEQPYAVPDNWWCWVRASAVLKPMETANPSGKSFDYIDIDAIDNKAQAIREVKTLPVEKAPSRAKRKVHDGDTLFSMVRPYLRNIAYVDSSHDDCIASTGFYVCSPNAAIDRRYLYHLLCSNYTVNGLTSFMKGDNSPSIKKGNFDSFPLPLRSPSRDESSSGSRVCLPSSMKQRSIFLASFVSLARGGLPYFTKHSVESLLSHGGKPITGMGNHRWMQSASTRLLGKRRNRDCWQRVSRGLTRM